MTAPMVEMQDIHTYYGHSYILQGLSLHVAAGEIVAVLGRNCVGKTTLMRSIIGFTPPQRGRIRFRGVGISATAGVATGPPVRRDDDAAPRRG